MSFLKATKELCRHPSNLNLNLEGNLRFRSIKIGIWSKNTCSQRIIFKRIGGTEYQLISAICLRRIFNEKVVRIDLSTSYLTFGLADRSMKKYEE